MVDVEAVKHSNPIAEVVSRHGIELRGSGERLTGRCPFHTDSQPSFTVYPATRSFYCFGCGAGGDVIDFVRRAEGLGVHPWRALAQEHVVGELGEAQ